MIKNNRFFWSHLQTKTTTVRVQPKIYEPNGLVFSVGNMIDLGHGRQTVMLDPFKHSEPESKQQKNDIAVPFCMGHIDFLYTSRKKPQLQNIEKLLSKLHKNTPVERIVIDVLSPGDLLVFKQEKDQLKIKMIDCLRMVRMHDPEKHRADHAV